MMYNIRPFPWFNIIIHALIIYILRLQLKDKVSYIYKICIYKKV